MNTQTAISGGDTNSSSNNYRDESNNEVSPLNTAAMRNSMRLKKGTWKIYSREVDSDEDEELPGGNPRVHLSLPVLIWQIAFQKGNDSINHLSGRKSGH
jgi:hypothetical protein